MLHRGEGGAQSQLCVRCSGPTNIYRMHGCPKLPVTQSLRLWQRHFINICGSRLILSSSGSLPRLAVSCCTSRWPGPPPPIHVPCEQQVLSSPERHNVGFSEKGVRPRLRILKPSVRKSSGDSKWEAKSPVYVIQTFLSHLPQPYASQGERRTATIGANRDICGSCRDHAHVQ